MNLPEVHSMNERHFKEPAYAGSDSDFAAIVLTAATQEVCLAYLPVYASMSMHAVWPSHNT